MTTLRIDLPWTLPPLTANQRMHWAQKARIVKQVRLVGKMLSRGAPKADYLVITLHYQPKNRRTRDSGNLAPTVKALVDGIIDSGIAPGDSIEHVSTPEPVIHPPSSRGPALWLVLHYPNATDNLERPC